MRQALIGPDLPTLLITTQPSVTLQMRMHHCEIPGPQLPTSHLSLAVARVMADPHSRDPLSVCATVDLHSCAWLFGLPYPTLNSSATLNEGAYPVRALLYEAVWWAGAIVKASPDGRAMKTRQGRGRTGRARARATVGSNVECEWQQGKLVKREEEGGPGQSESLKLGWWLRGRGVEWGVEWGAERGQGFTGAGAVLAWERGRPPPIVSSAHSLGPARRRGDPLA